MALQLLLVGPVLLELHVSEASGVRGSVFSTEAASADPFVPDSHGGDPEGHDCRVCALVLGAPSLPGGAVVLSPAGEASLPFSRRTEADRIFGRAVRRPSIRGPPGRA